MSIIAKDIFRNIIFLALFAASDSVLACGGFGNPQDGCADAVTGVWSNGGGIVEIELSGVNWIPNHACTGAIGVQYVMTETGANKILSMAMTSYTSGKGPVFFRCSGSPVNISGANYCTSCVVFVLGNSIRD